MMKADLWFSLNSTAANVLKAIVQQTHSFITAHAGEQRERVQGPSPRLLQSVLQRFIPHHLAGSVAKRLPDTVNTVLYLNYPL